MKKVLSTVMVVTMLIGAMGAFPAVAQEDVPVYTIESTTVNGRELSKDIDNPTEIRLSDILTIKGSPSLVNWDVDIELGFYYFFESGGAGTISAIDVPVTFDSNSTIITDLSAFIPIFHENDLEPSKVVILSIYEGKNLGTVPNSLCYIRIVDGAAPAPDNDWIFSDVPTSHWAYNEIKTLTERGVLSGYPDGTFRPNALVTRDEFSKMMVLALGMKLQHYSTSSFADMPTDAWALPYVETAKRYLTGYHDGNDYYFKGTENAVREDMAVALVKALGLENKYDYMDYDDVKADLYHQFSDYYDISFNLQRCIMIAYKEGLINGYPNGTFGPLNPISRAETAALLIKVLKSDAMQKVTFD